MRLERIGYRMFLVMAIPCAILFLIPIYIVGRIFFNDMNWYNKRNFKAHVNALLDEWRDA